MNVPRSAQAGQAVSPRRWNQQSSAPAPAHSIEIAAGPAAALDATADKKKGPPKQILPFGLGSLFVATARDEAFPAVPRCFRCRLATTPFEVIAAGIRLSEQRGVDDGRFCSLFRMPPAMVIARLRRPTPALQQGRILQTERGVQAQDEDLYRFSTCLAIVASCMLDVPS